jgi:hypothetical protein
VEESKKSRRRRLEGVEEKRRDKGKGKEWQTGQK